MNNIILTSYGINTQLGFQKIRESLETMLQDCSKKKILLIADPIDEIGELLMSQSEKLGFIKDNITLLTDVNGDEVNKVKYDVIYVSEGNTFDIWGFILRNHLDVLIKECMENGAIYIGASAGAYIAGENIEIAQNFERDALRMDNYDTLHLVDGIVMPHFRLERYDLYMKLRRAGKNVYVITDEGVLIC